MKKYLVSIAIYMMVFGICAPAYSWNRGAKPPARSAPQKSDGEVDAKAADEVSRAREAARKKAVNEARKVVEVAGKKAVDEAKKAAEAAIEKAGHEKIKKAERRSENWKEAIKNQYPEGYAVKFDKNGNPRENIRVVKRQSVIELEPGSSRYKNLEKEVKLREAIRKRYPKKLFPKSKIKIVFEGENKKEIREIKITEGDEFEKKKVIAVMQKGSDELRDLQKDVKEIIGKRANEDKREERGADTHYAKDVKAQVRNKLPRGISDFIFKPPPKRSSGDKD